MSSSVSPFATVNDLSTCHFDINIGKPSPYAITARKNKGSKSNTNLPFATNEISSLAFVTFNETFQSIQTVIKVRELKISHKEHLFTIERAYENCFKST